MKAIMIPAVPPSPNELRRKYRHPHAYKKLRQQWEHDLFYGMSCARHRQELVDQAKSFQQMRVHVTVYHSRLYDSDNLAGSQKPILDALKNLGFIADDSPARLDLLTPSQIISDEKKTIVRIGVGKIFAP